MVSIYQLPPATVQLGEGPHWDPTNQCLLFVDYLGGDLHRYFPATKTHQKLHLDCVKTDQTVGFVVPVENHKDMLVAALGRSLVVVEWPLDSKEQSTKPVCILQTVDDHEPDNLFNDGKCDRSGRLWGGTAAPETAPAVVEKEKGSLYCLNSDLSIPTKVSKTTLANGMDWSPDNKTFFFIDSLAYCVYAFDYDAADGKISNQRVVVNFKAAGLAPAIPDGMCTDQNGNIWVACFSGKKVICVEPSSGKVLRTIEMPTPQVTSVCWGGEEYSTLFVTSANYGMTADQLKADPAAGGLFAITGLGVKGQASHKFKVDPQLLIKKRTQRL